MIRSHGGIFGRNPAFQDVEVQGDLTVDGSASFGPGAGQTFTYTVRVNQVDTAITSSVSGTNTDSQDRTHVVLVPSPAGPSTVARVSLKLVTSSTAAARNHTVTLQITEAD